ncbi:MULTISPECIES: glycoside hydrolase family 28 protein [unclassified Duganella]|uniref:glycoside hydrolase family 28 protein n=1 Tax=unclassified Duganella TaxID=2636909 RepID=UPI00087E5453|nr:MULTISPECIES: glycosyl hydrolase family 28 protein [unclassified Duganella]SDF65162.1 Pectate lyase superfamily protein [Duganella sp. OV458]SDI63598.1 alpha-L-rhamnosidase [Duganella sp. OV510]
MTAQYTRRRFTKTLLASTLAVAASQSGAQSANRKPITEFGAVADGKTVNTRAIQAAIDQLAVQGGGTVVVPAGRFVSGALFLKPQVHLHLEQGAVLECSTDMANFPPRRTRIEGHFEDKFTPALINASGCNGLRITGEGTLDGAGRPIWDLFWKLRNAAKDPHNFPNLGLPRARLALIDSSRDVLVEGVTFKDSQFWNLHIYNCQEVTVRKARFVVPDDYKQAPSTDGIDLDSCQRVTIDGCYFSVTDDCIAAKGSKGPLALEDRSSPPVEHIRVRNCVFKRGHSVLTLGSEATIVRDVVIEDCEVGDVRVAHLKLRSDTPQHYEDIHYRNIKLTGSSVSILDIIPWSQYKNLQGQKPPQSTVRNITFTAFSGSAGTLGNIAPNPGQTTMSDIQLKDFNVSLRDGQLRAAGVNNLKLDNVIVNGKPYTAVTS